MSALGRKLRRMEGNLVAFWCPGCGEAHQVRVKPHPNAWGFNEDGDKPTFTPSVLVQGVRCRGGEEEFDRICDEYKLPDDRARMLADARIAWNCHSFVTDGRIRFLNDCTHGLAGQTVDLPDWPEGKE